MAISLQRRRQPRSSSALLPRRRRCPSSTVLLLAAALLAASAANGAAAKKPPRAPHAPDAGAAASSPGAVPLSSSVMVFGNPDLDQPSPRDSKCVGLMKRAAAHGARSVNLVLTQYWVDDRFKGRARTCNPDAWAEASRVDRYCYYYRWEDGCVPFNAAMVERVTTGLTGCLTAAFDLFDEVLVSPHLDDGTRTGHWRNMLVFDPLAKDAGGFSYDDIMIKPVRRRRGGGGAPCHVAAGGSCTVSRALVVAGRSAPFCLVQRALAPPNPPAC